MATGARPLSQVSRLEAYKVTMTTKNGEADLGTMSKQAVKAQINTLEPGEAMTIERVEGS
jgi:hypothetical protein